MSLLLDALKKAALEKQKRVQTGDLRDDTDVEENILEDLPAIESDISKIDNRENENIEKAEEISEYENQDSEQSSEGGFQSDYPVVEEESIGTETVEENGSDVAHIALDASALEELNETVNTEEVAEKILEPVADKAEKKDTGEDKTQELPPNSTNDEDAKSLDDGANENVKAEENKSEDTPESSQQDKEINEPQKTAIAQLLEKSSQVEASKKRRALILFLIMLLTAFLVVGVYFYILSGEPQPLLLPPAENNTNYTEEENVQENNIGLENVEPKQILVPVETSENVSQEKQELDAEVNAPVKNLTEKKTNFVSLPVNQRLTENIKTPEKSTQKTAIKKELARSAPKKIKPSNPVSRQVIQGNQKRDSINVIILRAYAAYQRGDLHLAKKTYDEAIKRAPNLRDALLGAAAVAARQGRVQDALHWYQQRLARAPEDSHALTGILALASVEHPDPRLKSEVTLLLRKYPQAAHLHFLRGAIHASEQDWAVAKVGFAEALRYQQNNPDYAYNLAIAHDHLGHLEKAIHYYRKALALAAQTQPSFDISRTRVRLNTLEGLSRE